MRVADVARNAQAALEGAHARILYIFSDYAYAYHFH